MTEGLLSDPPKVVLEHALTEDPKTNTWAAARTCYSKKVHNEDTFQRSKKDDKVEKRDELVEGVYDAGHHTTFEHNAFQFSMAGISRQAIWSFLHSHPFYNSEQQSQRFAPIDTSSITLPNLDPESLSIYQDTIALEIETFDRLQELLLPAAAEAYFERFPHRRKDPEEHMGGIKKKVQEIARYMLPVAMHSQLHHTVNEMTLLRMRRLADHFDVPLEQRLVVEGMFNAVREKGIELGDFVEDPIPLEETPEYHMMVGLHEGTTTTNAYFTEFDGFLDGRRSRLEGWYTNAEALLANVVRGVIGLPKDALPDEEAIRAILDPNSNPYLGEKMNVNAHTKLMRALHEVGYTFRKKLSHTADSQSQRHRTVRGAYPILGLNIGGEPDVITPALIAAVPEAQELFLETSGRVWENMERLAERGVSMEDVAYLLPNAKAIRKWESGDLYGLQHKQIKRLCYAAQEEIWDITRDEARGIQEVHPEIGKYFGAPCDLRHAGGVKPPCPEGPRYCGVPVWRLEPEDRERLI